MTNKELAPFVGKNVTVVYNPNITDGDGNFYNYFLTGMLCKDEGYENDYLIWFLDTPVASNYFKVSCGQIIGIHENNSKEWIVGVDVNTDCYYVCDDISIMPDPQDLESFLKRKHLITE